MKDERKTKEGINLGAYKRIILSFAVLAVSFSLLGSVVLAEVTIKEGATIYKYVDEVFSHNETRLNEETGLEEVVPVYVSIAMYRVDYMNMTVITPQSTTCYWYESSSPRVCYQHIKLFNNFTNFRKNQINLNRFFEKDLAGTMTIIDNLSSNALIPKGSTYEFDLKFTYPANAKDKWNLSVAVPGATIEIDPDITGCSVLSTAGATYNLTADITDSSTSSCISINADNITLDCQGHKVDSTNTTPDHGIVSNNENATITNCTVTEWDTYGIYLYSGNDYTIKYSNVSKNVDDGINLWKIARGMIKYTTSSENSIGIRISNSTNINITGSNAKLNTYGILDMNSDYGVEYNLSISDSIIADNYYMDISHGVGSTNSQYCEMNLVNVTGTNGYPIEQYEEETTVEDKILSELIMCGADNSIIDNVTIKGSNELENNGLLISFSKNVTLRDVTISNTSVGLQIYYSNETKVYNTQIEDSGYGVYLYAGTSYRQRDNEITNITIIRCGTGLYIGAINSTIINATIINSTSYGIRLAQYMENSTIRDSKVGGSITSGLYFVNTSTFLAEGNRIYNCLINETNISKSSGGFNTTLLFNTTNQTGTRIFSSGTNIGGNYWTNSSGDGYSDTCDDTDCDGFCDDYYNLSVGSAVSIDYLPLSNKYNDGGCEEADTCTCPGEGEPWEIDMGDYCWLNTPCNLGSGTISFINSGNFTCNSTLNTTNFGKPPSGSIIYVKPSCLVKVDGT